MAQISFRYAKIRLIRKAESRCFPIAKAVQKDKPEILRLMQDVFFKKDPSSIYTKVSENPQLSPIMLDMSIESLQENISFIAKENEKDTKAIGVAINGLRPSILKPDYLDSVIKQLNSKSEKTLLELWKYVSLKPPNPEKVFAGASELFEIRFLVVDPAFQSQGIAKSLVIASIKEAKEKKYKFVRVDCTSQFTARIASRAGLQCIYELHYKDYVDPRGEKIFKEITQPHTTVHVCVGKNFN